MLMPVKNVLKCKKCGYEKEKSGQFVSKVEMKEREVTVLEERSMGMPTTKARCAECGNDVAYWWMRQLRSADESEVRFFRCTKCGYTWRDYR